MPPLPKDPAIRQRQNKASTRATLRKVDPAVVIVPELPNQDSADWHKLTLEWWARIWRSPMAAEWDLDGDLDQLYILAMLVDEFWSDPKPTLAAEIRQQRMAFGLTPLDRRRLEWTIERAEEAKAAGRNPQRKTPKRRAKADPLGGLSAVK